MRTTYGFLRPVYDNTRVICKGCVWGCMRCRWVCIGCGWVCMGCGDIEVFWLLIDELEIFGYIVWVGLHKLSAKCKHSGS